MKLLLLTLCCVVATSLAGPFSDKEEKIEAALHNIEEVLKDLEQDDESDIELMSDIQFERKEQLSDFPPKKPSPMEEVLLYTDNVDKATAEIESVGGRVSIQMGYNLLITDLPTDIATKQSPFVHSSPEIPSTASKNILNKVKIYEMYRKNEYTPADWTAKTAPKALPRLDPLPADSPYPMTMKGKIVACIGFISGPGNLKLSGAETNHAYSEIVDGLKLWTENAPASAGLSFVVLTGYASVSVADRTYCPNAPSCHDPIVNAALPLIHASFNSKDDFAKMCKDYISGSSGSYLTFITKYNLNHFAYAYFKGGPIYMQYQNGYMGSDKIDVVYGHEAGHVFNAPDEYGSCDCTREYGEGTCTAKNTNCVGCAAQQVTCVMRRGERVVCPYTRKQIGWC